MGEETPICSPVMGPVGDETLFTEQSGGKQGDSNFPYQDSWSENLSEL